MRSRTPNTIAETIYVTSNDVRFIIMGNEVFQSPYDGTRLPNSIIPAGRVGEYQWPVDPEFNEVLTDIVDRAHGKDGTTNRFEASTVTIEYVDEDESIVSETWDEDMSPYLVYAPAEDGFTELPALSFNEAVIAKLMRLNDDDKELLTILVKSGHLDPAKRMNVADVDMRGETLYDADDLESRRQRAKAFLSSLT